MIYRIDHQTRSRKDVEEVKEVHVTFYVRIHREIIHICKVIQGLPSSGSMVEHAKPDLIQRSF